MKKYIFLLILIIVTSCNAQNKSHMTPEIDNKSEKFDSCRYKNRPNINSHALIEKKLNGDYIEMIESKSSKSYVETSKNSYYRITKIYYPNGNIKMKGLSANTGRFQKGIWYEFDEQGNLFKEIDYDKPFKFTFEDILKFCEKQNIKIEKGPILQGIGWHNEISRNIENGHPIWKIEHLKKINLVEIIKLDGITGEVLGTETYDYINN